MNIERILCPTNLTTESDEAFRYAVALSCAYNAKLFLLYCKDAAANGHASALDSETDSLFAESLAPHLGLADFCDLNWTGRVAGNVTDVGNAIVEEAERQQVDLIVMRSRRRPHAAVLLGSTAETVSRTAPCPVLVTHPREREWVGLSTGEIDLHRVLVAHDFSADSELAVHYGMSLAQEYQADVHLLHVISDEGRDEPEFAWSNTAVESHYKRAALKLQKAIPREAMLWCNLVTAVRCGRPYEELLAYAEEHEIDLICMGASGNDFSVGALFGSNVDRVLRQARCPVLVARPIKAVQSRSSEALEHAMLT